MESANIQSPINPKDRPATPDTPLYHKKNTRLIVIISSIAAAVIITIVAVILILSNKPATPVAVEDNNDTPKEVIQRNEDATPGTFSSSSRYEVNVLPNGEAYVNEFNSKGKLIKSHLVARGALEYYKRFDGTIVVVGRTALSSDYPDMDIVDFSYDDWLTFTEGRDSYEKQKIEAPAGHEEYTLFLKGDDTLWLINKNDEGSEKSSILVAKAVSHIEASEDGSRVYVYGEYAIKVDADFDFLEFIAL